jgi:hypothetical protein
MKTTKIIYYVTTGITSLMMLFASYSYLTQQATIQTFQHLGYPGYFRVELAIAKIIGVVLLWAPVSRRLKDLAYAGFTLSYISAFIAHFCSGDPTPFLIFPFISLGLLFGSYKTYEKLQEAKKPKKQPLTL